MSAFAFLLEREFIIALALGGAIVATIGSVLVRRRSRVAPQYARFILQSGYVLTYFSIGLFIVAGFAMAYGN